MSFGQPITKAFSAAMLSLTAVLIILLLLIGLTVSALPHNVRFSDASISQLNGEPVFTAQAVIGNPGPLPLEHSSAGLSFNTSPNFRVVALSQTASVGVGGNITLPVNLSIQPSRPAACELLFHGEEVALGFSLNTSVGGILPIYVESYTNTSFGALLGGLTVGVTQTKQSPLQAVYTIQYSFTDNNSYLPINATLLLAVAQPPQNTSLSIAINAYPSQQISASKTLVGQPTAGNITVYIVTMWGEFELPYNPATQAYTGDVLCG